MFGRKKDQPVSDPYEPARGQAPAPVGPLDTEWQAPPPHDPALDTHELTHDAAAEVGYVITHTVMPSPATEDIDLPLDDPIAVTGSHALPDDDTTLGYRVACTDCDGKGYIMVSVTDLLGEVVALVPAGAGPDVVLAFYTHLLDIAPELVELFPEDLLGPDAIKGQREKLWNALVDLFTRYRPTDPESMAALDTALAAWGRLHANFARSDGTIRGATDNEYKAVKAVLLATLRTVAGEHWKDVYDLAVAEAYDYAWSGMWFAQLRTEMTMPRYPRPSSDIK